MWKKLKYNGEQYSNLKISDNGNLMNVSSGHIYKLHKNKNGYIQVCVSLGSRNNKKIFKIHKAVAETFIPNPNNLPVVNHKDGIKTNNFVENLEWVTRSENQIHAIKMGLIDNTKYSGEKNYNSRFSLEEVKWIRNNYIPNDSNFGCRALAKKFNVHHRTIENIINNKTYKE